MKKIVLGILVLGSVLFAENSIYKIKDNDGNIAVKVKLDFSTTTDDDIKNINETPRREQRGIFMSQVEACLGVS